jgi:alpha-methylacyl-CoA racemase
MASGPLTGVRILEFAGIGPVPFCCMLLADLGADIVRIDRKLPAGKTAKPDPFDVYNRSRRSVALDLKNPQAVSTCLTLIESCDAIVEGFRPGVMERLGLGPDLMLKRNPTLVYGRMTGWGQHGPMSQAAGHDLNYIALTGALSAIGTAEKPIPPLNLAGDYGGGALYLAFGVLAGVIHARATGKGQVVDCAMSDGAASLMASFYGFFAQGMWHNRRAANMLDGGAHYYNTYACADGKFISIASAEPQFYQLLRERVGLSDPEFDHQHDEQRWPVFKQKLAAIFKTKTRAEWCALLENTDACFAPVLDLAEAPEHPHNKARRTFVSVEGVTQPAPAPRFSLTPGAIQHSPAAIGAHNESALKAWGLDGAAISRLRESGAM